MVLPTATPGISQKSLCMKPCGPAGQHPHDPLQVRGVRDPPFLVSNGLSQSLSSVGLIISSNTLFDTNVFGCLAHGSTSISNFNVLHKHTVKSAFCTFLY